MEYKVGCLEGCSPAQVINLLFASNYNMMVIERLLKEGYYPMDYSSSDKLIKKGIYFKLQ